MSKMKLLIWGAGAIGGTIGAYFVRAGHGVTFVDVAKEHVNTINAQGLYIEGPIDTFNIKARAFLPGNLKGTWQTVLLCTKGHHTEEATNALKPFLSENGYVVSVQNGLNEHLIAKMLGAEKTVGSFVNFGADYLEPGLIHYAGRGAVVLGELDGAKTKRLEALHKLFLNFDDRAIITPNIWGYLWGKMGYGALLYATAVTNESIADALDRSEFTALFTAIGKEVLAVAQSLGIRSEGFNGFDPNAFMSRASPKLAKASLYMMVAFNQKSAKSHSGIWRDLAIRKRKTEVDAHLGMIATIAKEQGLATPLLNALINQIHEIEEGKRNLSTENLRALEGLRRTL